MFRFLVQPQKELQLNLKTSNTQTVRKLNCMKSNKQGLKEATIIRQVGGMETQGRGEETQCGADRWQWRQNRHGQSHIHMCWIKIGRDTLGAGSPSPRPDHTAQDSSAGKINPHNF